MRIAVVYKWARDPEAASVRADGSIDWRGAKMTPGEDDPAALAAATTIAGRTGGEVVGVTIGDGDPSWILARGVTETLSVPDAGTYTDGALTGRLLAAAVRRLGGVDVVAIGDPGDSTAVPAALAGALGVPAVLGLASADVEGGRIVAVRRVGSAEQRITVDAPVVLGFAAEGEEKKVPGMKEMLMARKRPVTTVPLADLGVATDDRLAVVASRAPEEVRATVFGGDPAAAARELVSALRAEGVL